MSIRDIIAKGGSTAEGIAKLATAAEIKHAAQWQPGSVTPVAEIRTPPTGEPDGDWDRQGVPRLEKGASAGTPAGGAASQWTLRIDDWMPAPLNTLQGHWAKRSRLKAADRERINLEWLFAGIPNATRKRRVTVHIVLPKGKRAVDGDALHKSLRDALVHCGALKNDTTKWCVGEDPTFSRGERLITFVTLEDVA